MTIRRQSMVQKPEDTSKTRKRRTSATEKLETVGQLIRENPIRAQLVYAVSGVTLGTVTPEDDGTWSGCRYGPGYPNNTIEGASEQAAIAYVADGEEVGDGPVPDPWVEAIWRQQEEEAERYEAKKKAARAAARAAKRKS
jgi:hypothetical protein